MTRFQKRINIILFYLLLVVALIGVIYFIMKPEMTCTDGIKNQGEERVDCGGPCSPCKNKIEFKDLVVKSVERVEDGKGTEDVLIKIYNPNEEYGAKSFRYTIYDGDINGSASYRGEDFILPKETKYIVINKYRSQNKNGELKIVIDKNKIDWKKITNFKDPNLIVYNDKYTLASSGTAYSELTGLLVNKSAVDYEVIKVKGILRDAQGKLVATSYQIMNTLPSSAKREFHIIFPNGFSHEVVTEEIQVETNIFDSENYLKAKGQQDRWDQ